MADLCFAFVPKLREGTRRTGDHATERGGRMGKMENSFAGVVLVYVSVPNAISTEAARDDL